MIVDEEEDPGFSPKEKSQGDYSLQEVVELPLNALLKNIKRKTITLQELFNDQIV